MHQFAQVAPLALSRSCCSEPLSRAPGSCDGAPRPRPPRSSSRWASWCPPPCSARRPNVAAADLSAPDRPSVPAPSTPPQAHALPGDANNVRIAMTENDGLDVIVDSPGGVSAPGVAELVRRPVPPDGRDLGGRHRARLCRPVDPGAGEPDDPDGVAASAAGSCTLCVASGSPTVHGTLTALYNSLGSGAGRSTRCRSSSTWRTRCPASRRRAGPASVVPAPRA